MTEAGIYLFRGKTYTGMRAVAEASGRDLRTIRYHLEKYGHLDLMARKETISGYWIGGRPYASKATIARLVGENRETVQRWIAEGKTDRIIAKLREVRG